MLSDESRRALELISDIPLPGEAPIDVVRDMASEYGRLLTLDGPDVGKVFEDSVKSKDVDVPVRVYVPESPPGGTLVWAHGGGWFSGSVDDADPICRTLSAGSGWTVISVDYRLPPEHRFPTALEDVHAVCCAARALSADIDRRTGGQLAIGGDSAGGNLAAALTLMARDRESVKIDLQLLAYPVLHCHLLGPVADLSDAHLIQPIEPDPRELRVMQWEWEQYLEDCEQGSSAYAAPLSAESLVGLPPAVIVIAGNDILRSEDELYAKRMSAAGVDVDVLLIEGTIHGFLELTRIGPTAAVGLDHLAGALREFKLHGVVH